MKKNYSFPSLISAFPRLFFLIAIVFVLPIKAQIYTPSGTIQGTSGANNVGIGTANPIGKLEVVTGGPGITYDVASQTNGSVSFANFSSSLTAPVISGKSINNSGLVLMAASNAGNSNADMRFDIRENDNSPFTDLTPIGFRFQHFGTPLVDILRNGNVGIGATTPIGKLDIFTGVGGTAINVGNSNIPFGTISIGNASSVNALPIIIGKSDDSTGLLFQSGVNDNNTNSDMSFNIRKNNNSDFTTLTSTGFRFNRFGTTLVDILRNGRTTINTSSSGTLIDALTLTNSNLAAGTEVGLFFSATQATGNIRGARISAINDGSNNVSLKFYTGSGTITEKMRIDYLGNVGIGVTNPNNKLDVNGTIHSKEVKVDLDFPADYVFEKYYLGQSSLKPDYKLLSLAEVEKFTKENHHLPNVPSALEIKENGLQLGEMSNMLLQKIEELTLYMIEMKKENEEMKKAIELLKVKN